MTRLFTTGCAAFAIVMTTTTAFAVPGPCSQNTRLICDNPPIDPSVAPTVRGVVPPIVEAPVALARENASVAGNPIAILDQRAARPIVIGLGAIIAIGAISSFSSAGSSF